MVVNFLVEITPATTVAKNLSKILASILTLPTNRS